MQGLSETIQGLRIPTNVSTDISEHSRINFDVKSLNMKCTVHFTNDDCNDDFYLETFCGYMGQRNKPFHSQAK